MDTVAEKTEDAAEVVVEKQRTQQRLPVSMSKTFQRQ